MKEISELNLNFLKRSQYSVHVLYCSMTCTQLGFTFEFRGKGRSTFFRQKDLATKYSNSRTLFPVQHVYGRSVITWTIFRRQTLLQYAKILVKLKACVCVLNRYESSMVIYVNCSQMYKKVNLDMALDFPLIFCIQSHKFLPFEWFSSRSECVFFKSI